MPFQRMMLGQLRMVEISLHIVGHADPVHHMTRTKIAYELDKAFPPQKEETSERIADIRPGS